MKFFRTIKPIIRIFLVFIGRAAGGFIVEKEGEAAAEEFVSDDSDGEDIVFLGKSIRGVVIFRRTIRHGEAWMMLYVNKIIPVLQTSL